MSRRLSFPSLPPGSARPLIGLLGALAAGLAPAATNLGTDATFGVLSTTFTRNIGLSAVTGDLGFTTLGGSGTNSVSGTTYTPSPTQAGTDEIAARNSLNGLGCSFTFAGAFEFSTDATHGEVGVYAPGVYCITGAMNIGGGMTLTLTGKGAYVFRSTGAFTTSANSRVVLTNGAEATDVYWVPVQATTLGANSVFAGTVIDDAGITVGSLTAWSGRALAFLGTVTLDTATITFPPLLQIAIISATAFDFGAVAPGSVNPSGSAFVVLNSGNVPATLALEVTDPAPWTSVTTGVPLTAMNTYELDAQFNAGQPAPASWVPADHALRLASPGPDPSTGSRFAGNETGVTVPAYATRDLWTRLLAPGLTDQTDVKQMIITITAQP